MILRKGETILIMIDIYTYLSENYVLFNHFFLKKIVFKHILPLLTNTTNFSYLFNKKFKDTNLLIFE